MQGHEEAVQLLVNAGADLQFSRNNNFQRNALQIACGQGNEKIVELLLQAGAEVDERRSTSLRTTTSKSQVVVTRYSGRTALQAASERGHMRLVSRLLQLGADVNAPPSPTAGFTALQAASGGGFLSIMES
jgi:ankyrin repeat protein